MKIIKRETVTCSHCGGSGVLDYVEDHITGMGDRGCYSCGGSGLNYHGNNGIFKPERTLKKGSGALIREYYSTGRTCRTCNGEKKVRDHRYGGAPFAAQDTRPFVKCSDCEGTGQELSFNEKPKKTGWF